MMKISKLLIWAVLLAVGMAMSVEINGKFYSYSITRTTNPPGDGEYDPSYITVISQSSASSEVETTRDANNGVDCFKPLKSWDDVESCLYQVIPNSSGSSRIELGSDLDFGGYDEDDGACVLSNLSRFHFANGKVNTFDGKGYKIKGFCLDYAEVPGSNGYKASFFDMDDGYDKTIRNVEFVDAHIVAPTTHSKSFAGVVYAEEVDYSGPRTSLDISNVKVTNSYVKGYYASAVAARIPGVGGQRFKSIQVVNTQVEGIIAGGIIGHGLGNLEEISVSDTKVTGWKAAGVVGLATSNLDIKKLSLSKDTVLSSTEDSDLEDAYFALGGVVGEATSPVTFDISLASQLVISNSTNYTSYLGGIGGRVDHDDGSGIKVSKTKVDASISGGSVMGGFFGFSGNTDPECSSSTALEDDVFEGNITYDCKSDSIFVGGFVGRIYHLARFNTSILKKLYFNGNIGYAGDGSCAQPVYVGGLAGQIFDDDASALQNYSIGNIAVSEAGSSPVNVGYIVGSHTYNVDPYSRFCGNYHYGTSDESVVTGVGGVDPADWSEGSRGSRSVYGNLRNALPGIEPAGSLAYDDDFPVQLNTDAISLQFRNGAISAEDMKTDVFAALLNKITYASSEGFSRYDGVQQGLPFFADENYSAIYPITFSFVYDGDEADFKSFGDSILNLMEGKYPVEKVMYSENMSYEAYAFTNGMGKLNAEDVAFFKELEDDNTFWDSWNHKLSEDFTYTSAEAFWLNSVIDLPIKYHLCTSYFIDGVCPDGSLFEIESVNGDIDGFNSYFVTEKIVRYTNTDDRNFPMMLLKSDDYGANHRNPSAIFIKAKTESGYDEHYFALSQSDNSGIYIRLRDAQENILDNRYLRPDTLHVVYEFFPEYSPAYINVYANPSVYADSKEGEVEELFIGTAFNGKGINISDGLWSTDPVEKTLLLEDSRNGRTDPAPRVMVSLDYGYRLVSYDMVFSRGTKELADLDCVDPEQNEDGVYFFGVADYDEMGGKKVCAQNLDPETQFNFDSLRVAVLSKGDNFSDWYMGVTPTFDYIDYTISFDYNEERSDNLSDVYLGYSWKNPGKYSRKSDLTSELPKVYRIGYELGGWSPQKDVISSAKKLDSDILSRVVVDENDSTRLFAYWENNDGYYSRLFLRPVVDEEIVDDADFVHGRIVLKQVASSDDTLIHETRIVDPGQPYTSMAAMLSLPSKSVRDTFIFKMSAVADTGYLMTLKPDLMIQTETGTMISQFAPTDAADAADEGGIKWGVEYPETAGDTILTFGSFADVDMEREFFVDAEFKIIPYNIVFTRPDEESGLFFANNEDEVLGWVDENVYDAEFRGPFPEAFTQYGCRVGWLPSGSKYNGEPVTELTNGLLVTLDPKEDVKNVLSLSTNRSCENGEYYELTLTTDGHGTLEMLQILGDDEESVKLAEPTVIRHRFNKNGLMFVPKIRDNSVKLMAVAYPDEGYVLKDVSFDFTYGKYQGTFVGQDSMVLDITEAQNWHVTFDNGGTHYVTYDLGLTAEELAGVFAPNGNSNLVDGFETEDLGGDDLAPKHLMTLFHKNKTLKGWSLEKPENRVDGNQLFTNYNSYLMQHTSTDEETPTKLYAVWEDVESVNGQKVAVMLETEFASVVAVQILGTDTISHEFAEQTNNYYVLNIPEATAEYFDVNENDNQFLLKFEVIADTGYELLEENFVVEDYEGNPVEAQDGFYVATAGKPLNVRAYATEKPEIKVALDVNLNGSKAFYASDWSDTVVFYFDGTSSLDMPTGVYRTDSVIVGWTLVTAQTEPDAIVYTEMSEDLRTRLLSDDRSIVRDDNGVATMRAVWEPAQIQTVVVYNDAFEKGSMFLYQVDRDSFEIPVQGLIVPLVDDGLEFGISFAAGAGYRYAASSGFEAYAGLLDVSRDVFANGLIYVDRTLKLVPGSLVEGDYIVALDADERGNFFGKSWTDKVIKKGYTVIEQEKFPMDVFRNDACIEGWFINGDLNKRTFENFGQDFVVYAEEHEAVDEDYVITVLPKWGECGDLQESVTVTQSVDSMGVLKFVSAVGDTFGLPLVVPKADLEFQVILELNEGYSEETNELAYYVQNGKQKFLSKNVYIPEFDVDLFASATKVETITLTFTLNADSADVFYRDLWSPVHAYDVKKDTSFAMEFYRVGACFEGWAFAPSGMGKRYREFDEEFREDLNVLKRLNMYDGRLYGVWNTLCDQAGVKITSANLDDGVMTLRPFAGEMRYVVGDDGLVVPAVGFEFQVRFEPNDDVIWRDEGPKFVVLDTNGQEIENAYIPQEDVIFVGEQPIVIKANVEDFVDTTTRTYRVAYNVNNDSSTIFYGENWSNSGYYEIHGVRDTSSYLMPDYVYTGTSCVVGWSLNKSVTEEDSVYTLFNRKLAKKLAEGDSVNNLYAVWAEGEKCSEYTRLKVSAKHGYIRLLEMVGADQNAEPVVHEFTADNSMLIPRIANGTRFRIEAVPDSSYMMDSLVFSREGVKGEVYSYLDGDALPFDLANGVLNAFFSKANKTDLDIVDLMFEKSGSAVRISFATSEFEVTRGVEARITLMDVLGNVVVDSVLTDSITKTPESISWSKYPMAMGDYMLIAELADDKDTVSVDTTFSVESHIIALGKDEWQMVSMVAVDTAEVVWDGDPIFYWWDEVGEPGEFWQYKEFEKNDSIVPTRGFWYSSLEGRALPLKSDMDSIAENITWELDSLYSGWNLVANPYGWSLNLYNDNKSEVKDVNEDAKVKFWKYNHEIADYEEALVVGPYEAVWAEVQGRSSWNLKAEPEFNSDIAADFPELGQDDLADSVDAPVVASKRRALFKANGKGDWFIQAVLTDNNGRMDSWNILGVSDKPFVSSEPPAPMGDHVSLSIQEGKKALAKSFKKAADSYEWQIALGASSDRFGYLSFGGIAGIKSLGYHVYVTVDGKTSEVLEGEKIRVALKAKGSTATVRVTEGRLNTVVAAVNGLRMNQSAGSLNVGFQVDESLAGSRTVVDIVNLDGKVMATYSTKAEAGYNLLHLDAPKSGLYMLRVRVASQQVAGKIMVK